MLSNLEENVVYVLL